MQYFFADVPMKKKNVRGGTALFGHQVQNIFFALIIKIILQPLVKIIFLDIINFFFEFWDEQNEIVYI